MNTRYGKGRRYWYKNKVGFKLKIFVSNWFFLFQSAFLRLKSAKKPVLSLPGSNDKCRLHRKWCMRHFCFLLAAIIGGENIYRNVRSEPERIHENWLFSKTRIFAPTIVETLKNILLLVRHCRDEIVVVPGHVFHQALHLRRVGSAVGLRRNISVPQFLKRTSHKLTSL